MKKITLERCLCICDEGEIEAAYDVDNTAEDIAAALDDSGYFDDDYFEDNDAASSIEDLARKVLEDGIFSDPQAELDIILGARGLSM